MAKAPTKAPAKSKAPKSQGNAKMEFGAGSKKKRTSIGNSKNSRPKDKAAVREKKGR